MGGLAQGPEEKRGFAGRVAGFAIAIAGILTDMRPSLGKGVPQLGVMGSMGFHNIGAVENGRFSAKNCRSWFIIGNTEDCACWWVSNLRFRGGDEEI